MEKQKDTFYSATGLLPFYYQGKNGKTSYTYYEKNKPSGLFLFI